MKKFRRIFGILSGSLAVVGIILIIIGVATGGVNETVSVVRDKGPDFGLFFDFGDFDGMEDIETNMQQINSNIDSIDFEGKAGEFNIKAWDKDYVAISIDEDSIKAKYSVEGTELKVKARGKVFGWFNISSSTITVYVPQEKVLKKLDLELGAGHADVTNIKTLELKADIGMGDASIQNISTEIADIEVGMGNLDMNGIILKDADFDCGMGNISVDLQNLYTDFNYDIDVALGDVTLGENKYSNFSTSQKVNNNADKKMNIDCGMGNIDVSFSGN